MVVLTVRILTALKGVVTPRDARIPLPEVDLQRMGISFIAMNIRHGKKKGGKYV